MGRGESRPLEDPASSCRARPEATAPGLGRPPGRRVAPLAVSADVSPVGEGEEVDDVLVSLRLSDGLSDVCLEDVDPKGAGFGLIPSLA